MKKRKLKKLLKIGILTFGISFLIIGCSKDDIAKVELTEIQKIQNEFSLKDFENPFVKNNLQINWNDFKINLDEDSYASGYEFSTTLKANDFIESGKKKLFFKYKLEVLKIGKNQWDFEIIKFISENKESLENASSLLSNDFSGTIAHFNLNGQLLETEGLEKGIKIIPNLNKNIYGKEGPIPTEDSPPPPGGGSFQWIEVVHYTDWYKVYPDGYQEYTHSVYNYSSWEYVYVPYDNNYSTSYHNHTSAGGGYNGSTSNHSNENIVDKSDFLNFNSLEEFKSFIKIMTFDKNITVVINQDGTHTSIFKVRFNYIATLNININQKLNDSSLNQKYEVKDINTVYSGFTLGTSWNQSSFDYIIFNNTAIIDLYGSINYNLFIEGIGTVYTDFVHYQMIVDINTGKQISITEQP